jgi:hypothetical protein
MPSSNARSAVARLAETRTPMMSGGRAQTGVGELHVFCPECWEWEFGENDARSLRAEP